MKKSFAFGLVLANLAFAGCVTNDTSIEPSAQARRPSSVTLDPDDLQVLKVYTAQGYLVNQEMRSAVPLSRVKAYLNPATTKTCQRFLSSEQAAKGTIPYFDKIKVDPTRTTPPTDRKLMLLLEDALQRLPAHPGTTYRGALTCDFLLTKQGQPREAFIEKAFLSTSQSKDAAEVFTHFENNRGQGRGAEGCLIRIAGRSGRVISNLTGNYGNEEEVLFPADTAFQVLSRRQNNSRLEIELRELDPVADRARIDAARSLTDAEVLSASLPDLFSGGPNAAAERERLSQNAEQACKDAYRFFTKDPAVRSSIDKADPTFDLRNKKINASDFEEGG